MQLLYHSFSIAVTHARKHDYQQCVTVSPSSPPAAIRVDSLCCPLTPYLRRVPKMPEDQQVESTDSGRTRGCPRASSHRKSASRASKRWCRRGERGMRGGPKLGVRLRLYGRQVRSTHSTWYKPRKRGLLDSRA